MKRPTSTKAAAVDDLADELYEALAGKSMRAAAADIETIEHALTSVPRLRAELLAANKARAAAERKLADVDELQREMASALRQAELTKLPVKPWQFDNCQKRLRRILDQKGRR